MQRASIETATSSNRRRVQRIFTELHAALKARYNRRFLELHPLTWRNREKRRFPLSFSWEGGGGRRRAKGWNLRTAHSVQRDRKGEINTEDFDIFFPEREYSRILSTRIDDNVRVETRVSCCSANKYSRTTCRRWQNRIYTTFSTTRTLPSSKMEPSYPVSLFGTTGGS